MGLTVAVPEATINAGCGHFVFIFNPYRPLNARRRAPAPAPVVLEGAGAGNGWTMGGP